MKLINCINRYRKIVNNLSFIIDKFISIIAAVLLITMVVDIFVAVIFRYLLGSAIAWSEEYARYAMIWMSLLGASMALIRDEHVSIEYFTSKIPRKINTFLYMLTRILMGFVLYIIISYGIPMVKNAITQISPGLNISMSIPLLSLPVFGVITLCQLILKTINRCFEE